MTGLMDGWMNRWMDGCMTGWMNGWMDGWMINDISMKGRENDWSIASTCTNVYM